MLDLLDTITSLAQSTIRDSLRELESRDRLTLALREAIRCGVSIDELSEMTGLTPFEIRRRTRSDLFVLSELETIAS